jgi:hypothetical protein
MLEFQLVVEPQEEGARRTTHFTYAVLTPEQYGRVKKLFVQCFPDVGLKWDPTTIGESLVGRPVRIRVSTELYEGERRNRTKQVLPAGGDESFMAL